MKKDRGNSRIAVTPSSGNVFADLNLPEPEEMLAKARLAHEICVLVERAKLTQTQAARQLGVDQPKVSALMRGRLQGFSTERLFRMLNALGQEVSIVIRPASQDERAGLSVAVET